MWFCRSRSARPRSQTALAARLVAASCAALAAFSIVATLAPGTAVAQERAVHIYNWSDYIDPKMLEAFTKETGIKVVYDTYDTNEILESKLLAGKSGYDVMVPSGPFMQRLIAAGAFQKLDKTKLPNLKHAWPQINERLQVFDPGNEHAVNYMWGTTGIGLANGKVKAALGSDAPPGGLNTWELLLKPEYADKLKACGINVLDAPEDVVPNVLRYLGKDPNSKDPAEIRQAAETVGRVSGDIRKFHSSEYINALANGDICLALGYSGDILQARKRAKEAGNGVDIDYVIPKEGALMWFDSFAIPKDAPNPDAAHAFIDFMMRPEVAAANSNFVSYASGNEAAKAFVKPEILDNPGIYPDAATMERLFTNTAFDEKAQRVLTRAWTRVKTGR